MVSLMHVLCHQHLQSHGQFGWSVRWGGRSVCSQGRGGSVEELECRLLFREVWQRREGDVWPSEVFLLSSGS